MNVNVKVNKWILTGLAMFAALMTFAQKPADFALWPEGAPHQSNDADDQAMIRVYLPDKKVATGRAVVICPGGGYEGLAMDHEGNDWASFFNQEGIAAFVLKYRMPHGNRFVPIEDAEEAMRWVRRNAENFNVKPDQVGIMGSSAGGHLASTIATHAPKEAMPDFQILFYPVITMMPDITHKGSHDNFLGGGARKKEERDYSNDTQVTRVTPRAWIALSDDDHVVLPANGLNYYTELYRHDVPASLHIYPSGGHGWGFRSDFQFHLEMLLELKAWLKSF